MTPVGVFFICQNEDKCHFVNSTLLSRFFRGPRRPVLNFTFRHVILDSQLPRLLPVQFRLGTPQKRRFCGDPFISLKSSDKVRRFQGFAPQNPWRGNAAARLRSQKPRHVT